MAAPNKAQQDAEAAARQEGAIDPGEAAYAAEGADTDAGGADPGSAAPARPAAPAADDAPRAPPPVMAPFQSKRDAIISRFRVDRGAEPEADAVDGAQMQEFVRSGMPPEFTEPNAAVAEPPAPAAPDAHAQPAAAEPPAAVPQTVKVKVNGQVKDLSLEELIAKAQIALASEDILGDAKRLKSELDTLVTDARSRVTRTDPAGHHAGEQPGHHADAGAKPPNPAPAGDPPPNQEDAIAKLIETMQFGDPGEARALLQDTIAQTATAIVSKAVPQALEAERFRDEGARTQKVLTDFLEQHADLANDPMAHAAIERNVYDLQVADLQAIGVDPSRLPTQTGQVTPADIATAHRWYRAKGWKVRGPEEMLATARDNFLTWKGVAPAPSNPTNPVPPAPRAPQQPTVEVVVDRSARQQTVPQQPSRTVTPRPDPAPAAAQRTDGSTIVQRMNARRSLPRGRTA